MILWSRHGDQNQRFKIKQHYGKYLIMGFNGGTMEVAQSSTEDGARIYVSQPNNTPNEQWEITPAG